MEQKRGAQPTNWLAVLAPIMAAKRYVSLNSSVEGLFVLTKNLSVRQRGFPRLPDL